MTQAQLLWLFVPPLVIGVAIGGVAQTVAWPRWLAMLIGGLASWAWISVYG